VTDEQSSPPDADSRPPVQQPFRWSRSDRLWRLSHKLTPRYINYFLRVRSGKGLPHALQSRFAAMLLPQEAIDRALGEVHRLEDWVGAWSRTAQRFLGEARREEAAGRWYESAVARRNAAMAYHVAHLVTEDDPRTVRALRAAGVKAFSQAISRLIPTTRRVGIHWRTQVLPGYFAKPLEIEEPVPIVVLLNGATTTKEETLLWAEPLIDRGFAVLALDWPGTGEAAVGHQLSSHCDDMTDGLREFTIAEPGVDPDRMVLMGISLGAVVAARCAAMDRRIAAAVTVTPLYDPRPWAHTINPIVARQMVSLAGQAPSLPVLLEDFSLPGVTRRIRCPVLIFGAARDLVVPPEESMRLAAELGDLATLVWYPDGTHGLYDQVDDWIETTANWLAAIFDMIQQDPEPLDLSTQVGDVPPVEESEATMTLPPRPVTVEPPLVGPPLPSHFVVRSVVPPDSGEDQLVAEMTLPTERITAPTGDQANVVSSLTEERESTPATDHNDRSPEERPAIERRALSND
jgi:alpha-beta hydrolase superfamily lysophospholipase